MTAPRRIQRRRTKGWRMPEGAVYVGRGSRWGNPWRVERHTTGCKGWAVVYIDGTVDWCHPTREQAVNQAIEAFRGAIVRFGELTELRGRDLACWCPLDAPCHGDVLLDLANPHEWGANPGDGCVRCAGLPGDGPCEVSP